MQPTSILWRGLTMATGQAARFRLLSVEGWEERPGGRYDKLPRSRAHGAHPSPVWSDERIVTAQGRCWSSTERDELLTELQASVAFADPDDDSTEPLTVTVAGRTLTAGGQLLDARPALVKGEWGVGRFGWLAQWRCPDPLRYGTTHTLSTPLPAPGGGLAYPLAYNLGYGDPGTLGRITLDNPGTAPASILLAVTGPHEQGFEVSTLETGERLRYGDVVPDGQVITLDTATGEVLAEGTASRRARLTVADWMRVPAGGGLTLQYTSLGGTRDPDALLAATWAETYW